MQVCEARQNLGGVSAHGSRPRAGGGVSSALTHGAAAQPAAPPEYIVRERTKPLQQGRDGASRHISVGHTQDTVLRRRSRDRRSHVLHQDVKTPSHAHGAKVPDDVRMRQWTHHLRSQPRESPTSRVQARMRVQPHRNFLGKRTQPVLRRTPRGRGRRGLASSITRQLLLLQLLHRQQGAISLRTRVPRASGHRRYTHGTPPRAPRAWSNPR